MCYKLKSSLPTVELTNNGGYQSRNIVETVEFQNLIKKLQMKYSFQNTFFKQLKKEIVKFNI